MDILTQEEYQREREIFLELHHEEIKKMLSEKKKEYLEEELKDKTWKTFAGKYMKGVWLILIIGYFAWVKEVISLQALVGFALLELVVFASIYAEWKDEVKSAAEWAFREKICLIIRDFIWEKKLEKLKDAENMGDYLKIEQFHSIAEHEIPKNEWFRV